MTGYESGEQEKLCFISRPRRRWLAGHRGRRQRHISAADSGLAGTAEWPLAMLQQAFGCGWTGDSHRRGFEVAVQPAQ